MRIVGLSGYAGSGKDETAKILGYDGFTRIAFADKLKALALDLNPILDVWDDKGWRYNHLSTLIDQFGAEDAKKIPSVRKFYQDLGNKVREHLGEETWVQAAINGIDSNNSYVFADVRYPNEADAVRNEGGEIWRINRPGTGPVNDHISERAMDDYDFDRVFDNDGTLEDLEVKILAAAAEVWDTDQVLCY